MLFCDKPSFYAAQLTCLLATVVEANKKVEVQECRRWNAVGVIVERILNLLQPSPKRR